MAEIFKSLSDDMAASTAAAAQSIVRVEGRRRSPASGVIHTADGVIVTTNHVIERDDNLQVGLPDGSQVAATLIGRDPSTDIALLRVNGGGFSAANWAGAEAVRVGQLVLALARPGANVQASLGVVSAIEEGWRTSGGGTVESYIQTDVLMYPGFSGGPLVAADGKFIGLNSSALMRGASVTLPAATIARVASTLLAHGHIKRGYLGVSAQPVRLPEALAQALGQETGLLIASVEAGSPAEQGGIMLGDTLLTIDGQTVRHMDDLMSFLSGDRVGKPVSVRVVRGGQAQDMSVTIGERS